MNYVFIYFSFVKSIYLFLFIITIFTSCKKEQADVVQNNIESLDLTKNISTMNSTIVNENVNNVAGRAYIDLYYIQYNEPTELPPNTPASYFTEEFIEKAIKNPSLSGENIIFDRIKAQEIDMYSGGPLHYDSNNRFYYYTDTYQYFFDYGNYNIMLVTQKIDDIEYVRDYLILEKLNQESHLFYSEGTLTIDGKSPGLPGVTVVINSKTYRLYTYEDVISHAFYVNIQTRKIESVFFNTIRLTSEI